MAVRQLEVRHQTARVMIVTDDTIATFNLRIAMAFYLAFVDHFRNIHNLLLRKLIKPNYPIK